MDDVNGRWVTCSPGTVRNFSAVAYYFGRQLHRDLNVPVGLIHSSWGGTPAEAWTSGPQLKKYKLLRHYWQRLQKILASKPDTVTPQMMADYKAKLRQWKKNQNIKDPGNKGFQQGWAGETVDENDWKTMNLPGLWERAKDPLTINGAVWFRKEVYLPQSWAGKDLTLQLGRIDDFDVTYFNGTPVGEHPWGDGDAYATPRAYTVPGKLVRQGQNTIAVRVFDWKGGGGVVGPQLSLRPADQSAPPMSLNGPWQYRVEYAVAQVSRPSDPRKIKPNTPSVLFNGMIAPLIPYPLHGVIWYQGESNVSRAWEYRQLFAAMIDDWRTRWERPLPFIWVQLANYKARNDQPAPSAWAELREAQNMTLSQDATAQAVAIDIGDAGDIHPRNKQEVGRRLALAALGLFCGRDIVYSGPQFKTMTIDGPTVTLEFDFVGGGLFDPNGENVEGFALAGEDRTFHWAQARIVAPDKVVLSCPQVPDPVAVRYGWADNPRVDLYNKEGLPASPFRTDDWPGRTQPTE
jgi:sialate O-acetylesterase